ncbi:unnamed protein product, partial [Didymodactylos carnosus]
DLERIMERYVDPLREDETLSPSDSIESLYISVKFIIKLQKTFLESLENSISTAVLA